MKKTFIIFKHILAILLLVFLLVFTNDRQKNQKISLNNIIIKDKDIGGLSKKIILNYLQDKSVYFDRVFISAFNKEELENILSIHPSIKNVEVFSDQKGVIDILIEQKKAIVRIKSNTADYYLDELGEKMKISDNYTPKVLVATGNITVKDHIDIHEFVQKINQSDFWNAQITQIHFEQNDILLIPRVGDQKISIGNFKSITEKLDNLYYFYKTAIPIKGWQAYSDINLRFNNQIVCTKR